MKIFRLKDLTPHDIDVLCKRPVIDREDIVPLVENIIADVARNGDGAIRSYAQQFDGSTRQSFAIPDTERTNAARSVKSEFKSAVQVAARNIEAFHAAQVPQSLAVETAPGVLCRREWRPIARVGLYVPGGSAPLASTALMLGIPAKLAGCTEILMCSPPSKTGVIAPEILFVAEYLNITQIFGVGGAQAIAAMACGTETIPKVDKIFGPGNRFVAAAKSIVRQPPYHCAIDLSAGPTELLVIADDFANPEWVAADLLSQAEHGADSQVVLAATSAGIVQRVLSAMEQQLRSLSRTEIIRKSLASGFAVITDAIEDAIGFANLYAPEHLSLAIREAERYVPMIMNAGSVFVGDFCSVVFGDYASGTNHTLPTNGSARATGGITVESFMKPVSFQTVNPSGYSSIAASVIALAQSEGLDAHAQAVRIRGNRHD